MELGMDRSCQLWLQLQCVCAASVDLVLQAATGKHLPAEATYAREVFSLAGSPCFRNFLPCV